MRVVILGTGALGCLFAARLSFHAEVWMLGTWAEGVAAVQRDGIHVEEPDHPWFATVRATDDPAAVAAADVAMVLVKSYQTERAASWAAQVLACDGLAVTLQNGLDNGPRVAAAVGEERTAIGVTFEGATLLGPGHVRHAGCGPTYISAPPAAMGRLIAFVSLLQEAGFDAHVTSEVEGMLWGKAVVNAAINPLTALWRVPNGELLANQDRRALLAALAQEAAAVATARRVTLPFDDPVARVEAVCRATAANRSSMLQDVDRGRPTEIDSINGIIVAEGRRWGISTPVNEVIWRLVRGLSR
ncbi:MAG: 2-dehydropantoate 2-reductase [Anaerolineae bacterium]|nr:2-dehydropantoate 2-reductase [Anaerolineae bacterium]MDW8098224.1 2-dehydropantoate 2-reductase [Anaerolineae bacterium]